MAEKKRWIATYTKHIKQKRKVYHDGFLDFQITRRKVLLYDEEDNLLESRMLKADEGVSSGESLTFQAYLVDICEPKDGTMPLSDPKVQPSDQGGCGHKPFAVLRPNFKKTSLHSGMMSELSHQEVFKKRELHKYEALSPDSVNPTTKGTLPLGSANKGSNNHPLNNSPCDVLRRENDQLSKDVPTHKPLRDVNQILSILQRPNVIETSSVNNLKMSMSSTEIPPESDTSKRQKMESVSSRASSKDSLPQQFMVQETSTASTTVCSMTHLNDPPSFDLGI